MAGRAGAVGARLLRPRTRRSRRASPSPRPALAPALMALNTSAIYLGQATGAAGGGWLVSHGGYAPLNWVGLAWLAAALALSVWAGAARRRDARDACAGAARGTRARGRRDGAATRRPVRAAGRGRQPGHAGWRSSDGLADAARPAGRAARPALFVAFNRMALQGFGGVLAVAQLELVERQRWLTPRGVRRAAVGRPGAAGAERRQPVADGRRPLLRLARRLRRARRHAGAAAGHRARAGGALRPLGAPAGGGRRAARHGRGGRRAGHRQRVQAGAGARGEPARPAAGVGGVPGHLRRGGAAARAAGVVVAGLGPLSVAAAWWRLGR